MGNPQRRPGAHSAAHPYGGRNEVSVSRTEPIVFVVDDDVSVREALKNLLRSVGLRTEMFSSAQEFLSCGFPGPGCLILDIRLPGLSGLDLQNQLVATGRAIPIIFI